MNNDFEALDIIIESLFNIIDYIYTNYYSIEEDKFKVNIELGNLYTIYESDEDDEIVENNYVIVQKYDKSYI